MILFDRAVCNNPAVALGREWLETNGLGGFASSTIQGINTRRYHGLLTAATQPPAGRVVLLAKLEETLFTAGARTELSANRYPGVIHPQGYRFLSSFRLDPFPVFVYEVDGIEIEKSVFMYYGENTTVVEYKLRSISGYRPGNCRLNIEPLIAFRDYHSLTKKNDALDSSVEVSHQCATVAPYRDLPALHFVHNATGIRTEGEWYYNFEYDRERERGLDFSEDLYSPFTLTFDIAEDSSAIVIASTERRHIAGARNLRQHEVGRRYRVRQSTLAHRPFARLAHRRFAGDLVSAADQFLVNRDRLYSVIAGYHWFGEWSRDTMIALPGLTLTTGRPQIAKDILLEFAGYVDRGMLPNRFPDSGAPPEYNTVDGTLWLFEAIRALVEHTGDLDFVKHHLFSTLAEIVDWHIRGTRYNIHVDGDGLLACGEPGIQLTWMDAKVGDHVVTPRYGKPVEIQALWYNALRVMEGLAHTFEQSAESRRYGVVAQRAKESFNRLFWNDGANCLYDVVDGEMRDDSMRPNQIFAAGLPHCMLSADRRAQVVAAVQRHLLTPFGLRTLSPNDPRYRPSCEGGPESRDTAYHQGTVWPWLMGPFIRAYLQVNENSIAAQQQSMKWMAAFESHISDAGLGQISEIFDGDPPHLPRGCIAQAWSVAELLRVVVEDLSPDISSATE